MPARRTAETITRLGKVFVVARDRRSGAVWEYPVLRTVYRWIFGDVHHLCIRCGRYVNTEQAPCACHSLGHKTHPTTRVKLNRKKLDELITDFELSEQDLARMVGRAHSYINEQFKRSGTFMLHTIWTWCRVMDISVPIFLEQCGEENPFDELRCGQGD